MSINDFWPLNQKSVWNVVNCGPPKFCAVKQNTGLANKRDTERADVDLNSPNVRGGKAQPVVVALPNEISGEVPIGKNVGVDVAALSRSEAKIRGREHVPVTRTAVIGDI